MIFRPLLLLALLLPSALFAAGRPAGAPRPSFVVFLCDDLGYGDLGCFGSERIRTPVLDRLAGEGLKLTACYSASPVCSPSRAGLLTGRDPNRLGIRDWIPPDTGIYLRQDETTLPELLRAAGYRTGHFGKWHLNSRMDGTEPTPANHGYDYWLATQNNAAPTHQDPVNFVRQGRPVGPLKGNSSTLIVDEAIRFLRRSGTDPFLISIWFHAPHEPVGTPAEWTGRYSSEPDTTKRTYYGSVSLVDHEVGRFLAALEETGRARSTIVVFTSDNGPETLNRYRGAHRSHGSPGPFRGMKLHLTEAGIRVPGIVRWPGVVRPGTESDVAVTGLDVLPTFCEAAGAALPPGLVLDGQSVLSLLQGRAFRRARPLYWQYDRAISRPYTLALRDGDWKLLSSPGYDRWELHNLEADPAEARDMSSAEPERLARMAAELRRRHEEVQPP